MLFPPVESQSETDLIRNAVNLYRHVLIERGIDPRNYAPAVHGESAGFGWEDVQDLAGEAAPGALAYTSGRFCEAVKTALEHKASVTADAKTADQACKLAHRIGSAITYAKES